jgi:hypothetical protein
MIEVVNHLFDDFGVVSIAKVVKVAFIGVRFEVENARDRFLRMCQILDMVGTSGS